MEDILNYEEPLPPWAERLVKEDEHYPLGSILPTRDGRRMGNATVVGIIISRDKDVGLGSRKVIITDAGNVVSLYDSGLEEAFYPPKWVRNEKSLDQVWKVHHERKEDV